MKKKTFSVVFYKNREQPYTVWCNKEVIAFCKTREETKQVIKEEKCA